MRKCYLLVLVVVLFSSSLRAEVKVESNVIYGMYSGTALLMDVYIPAEPNGYGVIHISGSGWHAPLGYDARPLNQSPHVDIFAKPLAYAGFTVFTINHRAAPRFRYPAAVEDAQRAVRFIRYHAQRYGICSDRIGAIGGSSGGHLVSLLGLHDGIGNPEASDPVDRVSAKVQCVVARAAPADLSTMLAQDAVASFLGTTLRLAKDLFEEASPVTHVSPDDPPFLLLHGNEDKKVPIGQSQMLKQALENSGIPVKLIVVEGAGHGPRFPGAVNPPDLLPEIKGWFEQHLMSDDGS